MDESLDSCIWQRSTFLPMSHNQLYDRELAIKNIKIGWNSPHSTSFSNAIYNSKCMKKLGTRGMSLYDPYISHILSNEQGTLRKWNFEMVLM